MHRDQQRHSECDLAGWNLRPDSLYGRHQRDHTVERPQDAVLADALLLTTASLRRRPASDSWMRAFCFCCCCDYCAVTTSVRVSCFVSCTESTDVTVKV